MYDRRSVTETIIESDKSKMKDGSIDYLLDGLKQYTDSNLNYIENIAKQNIREKKNDQTGEIKVVEYMIRLGLNDYCPLTVLDAIRVERERRSRGMIWERGND